MIENQGVKGDTTIGVLCLDTAFTKIPGHIRNRATFDFPVDYQVVRGATPQRMVTEADPTLLEPFIIAAKELEARGVAAITSGCGFLVIFQQQLADAVQVPLYSSSLIQVPMVHRMIGANRKVGLLVAKKAALTRRHLAAIGGESVPICVAGMDAGTEFREVILEGRRTRLGAEELGAEVLFEIDRLAEANPDMGALVIECTDLVPYGHAIQDRLGLPVFDIVTLTEMVHRSLSHRPFREKRIA